MQQNDLTQLNKKKKRISSDKLSSWWKKMNWRKTSEKKEEKQSNKEMLDWKTLSPNHPPLPFLINYKNNSSSSEIVHAPSEIAPIFKDKIQNSSRELYTIVEYSETNTNNTSSEYSTPNNSVELSSNNQDVINIAEQNNQQTSVSTQDDPITDPPIHYSPIYDWPYQNKPSEPIFDSRLIGNEEDCKKLFVQLFLEAYQRYKQRSLDIEPQQMCLLFDNEGNIKGITFILSDQSREDYLKFNGPIQYIPPELSLNSLYHHENSDIWSLGISLYRMVVGKYPFEETNVLCHRDLFNKMLTFDYDIPTTLSADLQSLIQNIISPDNNRASFDSIRFHPWLKPYLTLPEETVDTQPQPTPHKKKEKKKKLQKIGKFAHRAFKLAVQGPYSPPDSYYDLVNRKR